MQPGAAPVPDQHIRQSLLLNAPHDLRWVAETLPPVGPGDVSLRTVAGAISIGSELPLYAGRQRGEQARYPLMTGYESLAVVTAPGRHAGGIAVGDRVVAFYGHRTAAVVPAARVVPVPSDIGDGAALLLILACDTARGVWKLRPRPGEPALVTGAGAIGLLTLFNLRARGATAVDVVEPLAERRELALEWGARRVFAPDETDRQGFAYAVGVECSSSDAAFALLQERLAPGGRICVLSDGNLEPLALTPAFHRKELSVIGSSDGLDYRGYAPWYWTRVRAGIAPLERMFQATAGVDQLAGAFADLERERTRPVKVLVRYPA